MTLALTSVAFGGISALEKTQTVTIDDAPAEASSEALAQQPEDSPPLDAIKDTESTGASETKVSVARLNQASSWVHGSTLSTPDVALPDKETPPQTPGLQTAKNLLINLLHCHRKCIPEDSLEIDPAAGSMLSGSTYQDQSTYFADQSTLFSHQSTLSIDDWNGEEKSLEARREDDESATTNFSDQSTALTHHSKLPPDDTKTDGELLETSFDFREDAKCQPGDAIEEDEESFDDKSCTSCSHSSFNSEAKTISTYANDGKVRKR